MATLVSTGQITIADMNDGLSIVLSNSSHLVPADASGVVSSFAGASTTVMVMQGAVDVTSSWTLSKFDTSCTSALATSTVTVSALSADVGYVDITATRSGWPSLTARFTVTKAKQGVTGSAGAAGANATAYWLSRSSSAISANAGGTYSPSTITFTGYAQTGVAAPAVYAGRFIVATSADGTTFTDVYTSAADESAKSYTPSAGLKAIRCRFYLAGGVVSMLDEETVAVVSDGLGVNLCDATWWSPTATFQWSKAEDVAGETSIIWGAGLKGQAAPLLKCLADSVNKCYQPECSGGGLTYWFPCQTITGTANASFIIDSTKFLTGPSSYKVTKASLATVAQGIACKAVPVVPGQVYTVKVSICGDTATAGVYAVINQAASMPSSGAINESNRASFTALLTNQPVAVTFNSYVNYTYTVPAGINAISLGVYSGANGPLNIWIDDPIIALSSMSISTVGPRQSIEGGYNGSALNAIQVNPNKTYRFVIPVKFLNGALSSQVYFGPENSTKVCTLNTSTVAVNPYFALISDLTDGVWYLMVGYIYPVGSTGATNSDAGIYDTTTGIKVVSGTNFCWSAGTTSCGHRAYQYYADNGSLVYFGAPLVHVVDGTEPQLRTWMNVTTSDIAADAVNAISRSSVVSGWVSIWLALVQKEAKALNGPAIAVKSEQKLEASGNITITAEFQAAASVPNLGYVGFYVFVWFSYAGGPAQPALPAAGPDARALYIQELRGLSPFLPVSASGNSRVAKATIPFLGYMTAPVDATVTPVVVYAMYYLDANMQPTTTPEMYAGSVVSNTQTYATVNITEWVAKV